MKWKRAKNIVYKMHTGRQAGLIESPVIEEMEKRK
jgi:hypothetical protein